MATLKNTFNGVSVYMSERGDAYGNPRCIVHFLDFMKPGESCDDFGGGFICQYDYCGGKEVAERVIKAREY